MKPKRLSILCGLTVALVVGIMALVINAQAQERLSIVSGYNPPLATAEHDGVHDLIETEAFRRIGIDIDIHLVPTSRAGGIVETGLEDALGPRIAAFGDSYKNLERVREPITDLEFVAFGCGDRPWDATWSRLRQLDIGHIAGSAILERLTRDAASLTRVRDAMTLIRLLAKKRIDVAIIERWQGLYAAKASGTKTIRPLSPPLLKSPVYLYLNRKHADLAAPLAAALRDMKADGTMNRLIETALERLM